MTDPAVYTLQILFDKIRVKQRGLPSEVGNLPETGEKLDELMALKKWP
jgi:hypothetical protein